MTSNSDPLVIFMPSGKRGYFPVGTPILDAARELGVYIESVCGGRGICGRCQIEIQTGAFAKHGIVSSNEHISPFGTKEKNYAEKRHLKPERRLSCSSNIQGNLVINVPQDVQVNPQIVRKADDGRKIKRNPAVHLCYVEVEEPDMNNPIGDFERLQEILLKDWGWSGLTIDVPLLGCLQSVLHLGKRKVTAIIHKDQTTHSPHLIALYPGLHNESYGIACDIGSTTIAVHLTSLLSGVTIATSGIANPQIRFGEDLMSRVSWVMMNPDGREKMTLAVREAINNLVSQVCSEAKINPNDIFNMTFVGNPVMHHLFLGINPTPLGTAPFALATSGSLECCARDLDLNVNPGARIYILPCIAGHVGADAAAAALAEGPHRQKQTMLLVDVGTNAEIILGNRSRIVAASSPTGPAFEGAEISCGQRAAKGAIERVRINPETLEPRIRVIGVEKWSDEDGFSHETKKHGVTGLCGSGIIEVVAQMFLTGLIKPDGIINGELAGRSDRIIKNGRVWSYVLWHGEPQITVSQTDIRAIQLAKAALYAGIRLLMDKMETKTVDFICLAGAFGSFIDPEYAMTLGLIPDCDPDKIRAVGNAAGTGAKMALLNRDYRREIENVVNKVEKIETALEPDFQKHFVNAMALPNRVDSFPKLEKRVKLPKIKMEDKSIQKRRRRKCTRTSRQNQRLT